MENITLRLADTCDAGAILDIYSYYILNTAVTSEYTVPEVEEFARRMSKIMRKYPYIVAERGGRIIGFAYAREFHDRAAYAWSAETSIYVAKDERRSGVGSLLYKGLEALLKTQNIRNLYACVTCPENDTKYVTLGSFKFHGSAGFAVVGQFHHCRYKFREWYGMVWMEKFIGPHDADQPPFIPFPELDRDKAEMTLREAAAE